MKNPTKLMPGIAASNWNSRLLKHSQVAASGLTASSSRCLPGEFRPVRSASTRSAAGRSHRETRRSAVPAAPPAPKNRRHDGRQRKKHLTVTAAAVLRRRRTGRARPPVPPQNRPPRSSPVRHETPAAIRLTATAQPAEPYRVHGDGADDHRFAPDRIADRAVKQGDNGEADESDRQRELHLHFGRRQRGFHRRKRRQIGVDQKRPQHRQRRQQPDEFQPLAAVGVAGDQFGVGSGGGIGVGDGAEQLQHPVHQALAKTASSISVRLSDGAQTSR